MACLRCIRVSILTGQLPEKLNDTSVVHVQQLKKKPMKRQRMNQRIRFTRIIGTGTLFSRNTIKAIFTRTATGRKEWEVRGFRFTAVGDTCNRSGNRCTFAGCPLSARCFVCHIYCTRTTYAHSPDGGDYNTKIYYYPSRLPQLECSQQFFNSSLPLCVFVYDFLFE